MREIKFRGLRTDGKGWASGVYIPAGNEKTYISQRLDGEPYAVMQAVNPDTVGQFTGLTDAHGVEIFEGDVLSYYIEEYHCERTERRQVTFSDGCYWLVSDRGDDALHEVQTHDDEMEIVGNVHRAEPSEVPE